jgi:hypothetical protein
MYLQLSHHHERAPTACGQKRSQVSNGFRLLRFAPDITAPVLRRWTIFTLLFRALFARMHLRIIAV